MLLKSKGHQKAITAEFYILPHEFFVHTNEPDWKAFRTEPLLYFNGILDDTQHLFLARRSF